MLFVHNLRKYGDNPAVITENRTTLSYTELADRIDAVTALIPSGTRKLIIIETANEIEPLIFYLAALKCDHPVILVQKGATEIDDRIKQTFKPYAVYTQKRMKGWSLKLNPEYDDTPLHPDLSILLSTSGTTGSSKLVRLSKENIEENVNSIISYLELKPTDRAITTLPFNYSYGLSIINTHLASGGALLLSDSSVATPEFWNFCTNEKATCLYGVPYTYDLLNRVNFCDQNHPSLRFIAQAGGRLLPENVIKYAAWARENDKKMYVMYGQTEAAPRMSYVPPGNLEQKPDTIGVPIPGGRLFLCDEHKNEITDLNKDGELVYQGKNVMMGYALDPADLEQGQGSDLLYTGDIAQKDEDGYFLVVGRKSRFCKIFGLRISLDEVEIKLASQGINVKVVGKDDLLVIATLKTNTKGKIAEIIRSNYKIGRGFMQVLELEHFPLLASGKLDEQAILNHTSSKGRDNLEYKNLSEAYSEIMEIGEVYSSDSFLSLGGDSLFFVLISIAIEKYISFLPPNWEALTIEELELLKTSQYRSETNNIPLKKGWATIGLIILFFILGEFFLQVRSFYKTGGSAFSQFGNGPLVIFNDDMETSTHRPNVTVSTWTGAVFSINSLGLRSREIPLQKEENEVRIAVVGASTVAGLYATTNERTFPALLEEKLRNDVAGTYKVNVINGGLNGNTVKGIKEITENILFKLRPDVIIIYPGFNDLSMVCNSKDKEVIEYKSFDYYPSLPGWVLSKKLIKKNTSFIRKQKIKNKKMFDINDLDTTSYRQVLEKLINNIEKQGIKPVLSTVARGNNNVVSTPEEKQEMAAMALNYVPCLDVYSLISAGAKYNSEIESLAAKYQLPVLDLAKKMPGGKDYFIDVSHFTYKGEKLAATIIFEHLKSFGLVN